METLNLLNANSLPMANPRVIQETTQQRVLSCMTITVTAIPLDILAYTLLQLYFITALIYYSFNLLQF